jgi:hypothetical protein
LQEPENSDFVPYAFVLCSILKSPYSAISGMIFHCKHKKTGEIKAMPKTTNLTSNPFMMQGWHSHFDPMKLYGSNFKKLTALEFITVVRQGTETIVQLK